MYKCFVLRVWLCFSDFYKTFLGFTKNLVHFLNTDFTFVVLMLTFLLVWCNTKL